MKYMNTLQLGVYCICKKYRFLTGLSGSKHFGQWVNSLYEKVYQVAYCYGRLLLPNSIAFAYLTTAFGRIPYSSMVKVLVPRASINKDVFCTGSNPPGGVCISDMHLM